MRICEKLRILPDAECGVEKCLVDRKMLGKWVVSIANYIMVTAVIVSNVKVHYDN